MQLILDALTTAGEKATWFFNEPGFIKVIEKFWILLPFSLIIKDVRMWVYKRIKGFGTYLCSQYGKVRILKRISELEKKSTMDTDTIQRFHNENTELMTLISQNVLEIGQTVKRISSRQRIIENTLGISKLELSPDLMVVDCTNEFLEMVKAGKENILGSGYKNYIYFEDREDFAEQIEIVKKELRENDFYIRMVQKGNGFLKYGVKILPFICIKSEFIGCSIIFRKI